jgi:hypothetical protein
VSRIAPIPHACAATLAIGLFQGQAPFILQDKPGFAWRTEASLAEQTGWWFNHKKENPS